METSGCIFIFIRVCSSLSSPFLLHRLIPPWSIFLPGSGNQCPSCKRSSHSVHSCERHQQIWGDFRTVCLCTTLPNFTDVRRFKNRAGLSAKSRTFMILTMPHSPKLPALVRKEDRGVGTLISHY